MECKTPRLSADTDGDLKADHGRFVRRWGLDPSKLPSSSAPSSELIPLLTTVWTEAIYFISKVHLEESSNKTSPWQSKGVKTFPHSNTPVKMYERVITTKELTKVIHDHKLDDVKESDMEPETWSLRRSVHANAASAGTADWNEWVRCFKKNHAEAEKEYTATVLNTTLMKNWNCKGIKIQVAGRTWVDWTMKWEESVHKLPFPLKKRVFPVLQLTAMTDDKREFLVVQIAVKDKDATPRNRGAVLGAYTSVERFRQTEGEVEWIMGTVSDAAGILPRWVQKRAVPAQIAKDVEMFLTWMTEERKRIVGTDKDTSTAANDSRTTSRTTSRVNSSQTTATTTTSGVVPAPKPSANE